MKVINEYDKRQFKKMSAVINSFEEKDICLEELIGSLDFLLHALESVENEWSTSFTDQIVSFETINAYQIINKNEEGSFNIDKNKETEIINRAISSIKTLIANSIKISLKKEDMKHLSFPNFQVEKIEFHPKEKKLKVFVDGAWLDTNGRHQLGKGVLFFENWDDLSVDTFDSTGKRFESSIEYLEDLCEFKIDDSSVVLKGFGKELGHWVKWKIINPRMHAEFES